MTTEDEATTPVEGPTHRDGVASPPARWLRALVTALFGAAACLYVGYHVAIAFEVDDSNHLETPLALALARQLTDGPGSLYGPYDGRRPLALIHAPLYYRLAGLGAWPMVRLGASPVTAAFAAGRVLAFLGFLATVAAVGAIAKFGRTGWTASAWAIALVGASPIVASLAATVRPDTLALGLQVVGTCFVLRHLSHEGRASAGVVLAYVAFALGFCVKQHNVVSAVVSSGLLWFEVARGRLRAWQIVVAHVLAVVLVVGYFGAEQVVTQGRMATSVFVVPAELRQVASAEPGHLRTVLFEAAKRSIGLLGLGLALLMAGPRRAWGGRLDGLLLIYLTAETIVACWLCLNSEGAWVNYFMPTVTIGTVLLARGLDRRLTQPIGPLRKGAVVVATLVVLGSVARLVGISATARAEDHRALVVVLASPNVAETPVEARYFVGAPQYNRLYANAALAHDEWLYASIEALGVGEPRERWLLPAVTRGPVRLIIVPGDPNRPADVVPGLALSLPDLGYVPIAQFGRFSVWERSTDETTRGAANGAPDFEP